MRWVTGPSCCRRRRLLTRCPMPRSSPPGGRYGPFSMTHPAAVSAEQIAVRTRFALLPFRDYAAALDAPAARGLAQWMFVAAAFVAAWFVYVPIHELLHAFGCLAAGGSVTRL